MIIRTLEMSEMEMIEGGLSCSSSFGLVAAGIVGGALLMASGPVGWARASARESDDPEMRRDKQRSKRQPRTSGRGHPFAFQTDQSR
mgnify:CR=1 FL=1